MDGVVSLTDDNVGAKWRGLMGEGLCEYGQPRVLEGRGSAETGRTGARILMRPRSPRSRMLRNDNAERKATGQRATTRSRSPDWHSLGCEASRRVVHTKPNILLMTGRDREHISFK
jgi:hypothetical protein